ncbi:MAG: MauE/DoxX family redox-associated membrane protein, partial [Jatrophihabitantaceae bacterium]
MLGYAVMFVRCLLVLVLAASAIGKWWHRSELEEFGRTLRLGLRLPQARLVAGAWVAVEGLTALLLVLPLTVGHAAVLAVLEFGCLTAGAAVLVAQHRGFACNCFGTGHRLLSWRTVLRNGALTAAAMLLVAGLRLPAAAAPAPVTLAAALTVGVGAVLAVQARPLRALLRHSSRG